VAAQILELDYGGAFVLARDEDGVLWAWGQNHRGQCGTGKDEYVRVPTPTNELLDKTIVKLAAGYQHSLALTSDNEVWATGRSEF